MTPRRRRKPLFAIASIAAGIGLIAFESLRPVDSPWERWFWLSIGFLLAALGIFELLAPRPPDEV